MNFASLVLFISLWLCMSVWAMVRPCFAQSKTLPDASLSKAGSYISACKHSASEWSEAVPLTQSRPLAGFDLHFKTMVTFYPHVEFLRTPPQTISHGVFHMENNIKNTRSTNHQVCGWL